jgi:hypothetical protein
VSERVELPCDREHDAPQRATATACIAERCAYDRRPEVDMPEHTFTFRVERIADSGWAAFHANQRTVFVHGITRDEAIVRAKGLALQSIAERMKRGEWQAEADDRLSVRFVIEEPAAARTQ